MAEWRQRDINFVFIGVFISFPFFAAIILSLFFKSELVPDIMSSLVIAELTLTLVWVEISKRPDFTILQFTPIEYFGVDLTNKAMKGFSDKDFTHKKLRFTYGTTELRMAQSISLNTFSFRTYIANIGHEESAINSFMVAIDDKRLPEVLIKSGLGEEEGVMLGTQQRSKIVMPLLGLEQTGFHKLKLGIYASTKGVANEVWFTISSDRSILRIVKTSPLMRTFGWITKYHLNHGLPKATKNVNQENNNQIESQIE